MRGSFNKHSLTWWQRISPGSSEAYAIAIALVMIASGIRWGLGFLGDDVFVFAAYYPAVLFATYIGGAGAGIFAAVLGTAIAWWAFIPPRFAFFPLTPGLETKVLAFLFACALIVWGADRYRKLTKRLEDEEKFRELAIEELAHRLKNKLATIQSIVSLRLREHPQTKDEILSSLGALSATDDLVMATQGQGARLRDILSAELGPYKLSQISMEGPSLLLPPKLALTMALLVHELATNAAKYGALSSSSGRISICWSLADARLNLDWRETGGPPVSPPVRRGFGTRLFLRALEPFSGNVDATFASTGLICKMSVVLPESASPTVPAITGKAQKRLQAAE